MTREGLGDGLMVGWVAYVVSKIAALSQSRPVDFVMSSILR